MRNGGFVVESLSDGKRIPVSSTQRIILLNDISVYTVEDDVPLREVFLKMKEDDKVASSVDAKTDPEKLKTTLKKILPDFDEERVYPSDIRKMFAWYNMLKDSVDFTVTEEAPVAEAAEVKEEPKEEVKEKKAPAKKTAAKKTTKKAKEEDAEEGDAEAKPAKKTAAKKAAKK